MGEGMHGEIKALMGAGVMPPNIIHNENRYVHIYLLTILAVELAMTTLQVHRLLNRQSRR